MVITPDGNTLTPPPSRPIAVPQHPWVPVTLVLIRCSRPRRLKKPRPVPKLGHRLIMVENLVTVLESLVPVPNPLLADRVVQSFVCVAIIPRSARVLRVVQFPIAPIKPGTRLYCPPRHILTAENVLLIVPPPPIKLPQAFVSYSISSIIIIRTMTVSPTKTFFRTLNRNNSTRS